MRHRKSRFAGFWLYALTSIVIALIVSLVVVGITRAFSNYSGPADKRFGLENDPAISAKVTIDQVTGVYWVIFEGPNGLDSEPVLQPDGTPRRVDNADIADVIADIEANEQRWLRGEL